jgi:hypothetical protein
MNVNQIIQEMTWRLGNRSDIQPRTLTWLNDGYFELLMSPRFTFYQLDKSTTWPTVPGQRVYQLSVTIPGYWFVLVMRNETNQIKMRKYDPSEFDRTHNTTGHPVRYARFADQVELDPTPNMEYQITTRYRIRPPELVNGGEHILTREWDEVITTVAVQKGWEALEQWDKASAQKNLVEVQLARRFDAFQMDDADSETTIGVEYGWS